MADVKYDIDGCIALANAIIAQAIDDYRIAIRGQWDEDERSNESVMREVNKFLHSSYYGILTKVSGDFLLEQVKKEYETGLKLVNEGNKIQDLMLKKPVKYRCPLCGSKEANVTLFGRKLKTGNMSYTKRYMCQECNITETRFAGVGGIVAVNIAANVGITEVAI